ncbi:MAG: oligopeptide/dipeptide ABC transporter ATP-binding protein [Promethearchaeota archaeon]
MCDKVYIMYAGRIVECANVFELFANPKHPYTRGLVQSVKSFHGFEGELLTIPGVVPDLVDPPPGCRFVQRCPEARELCHKKTPLSKEIGSGHIVSCWLQN